MKKECCHIKKELIRVNPLNDFEISDIEDLQHSIESFGIIEPLSVIGPDPDGNYKLISGERRLTAVNNLASEGKYEDDIPCYVIGTYDMDETEQRILIKTANIETRDKCNKNKHRAEVMELLKELVDKGELTECHMAQRAADLFKSSPRWGRYWRSVFVSDDEELKDMVKDNVVSIKNASKILSFTPEEQEVVKKEITSAHKEAKTEQQRQKSAKEILDRHTNNREKVEITEDELDAIPFDMSLLMAGSASSDVHLDESGRTNMLLKEEHKNARISAADVVRWCNEMLDCDDPTMEEWDAIYACDEVVKKFL